MFLLTVGIASLIAFAMLIPQILDNNRRYKENQALQIEERTLHYSTPATTLEQKAILRVILPKIELIGLPPVEGEIYKPVYPSNVHVLLLTETTPFCTVGIERLKKEIDSFNYDFQNSECHSSLYKLASYINPNNASYKSPPKFLLDLLKTSRYHWLNPDPLLDGVVLIKDETCLVQQTCWRYYSAKIQNSVAIVNISRAVVSDDKNKALILIEYEAPEIRFGYANLIELKRIDNSWVVVNEFGIYIS